MFQANLLSSHRNFISRIDVVELTDMLCHRGDPLSIFVFTDSIEVSLSLCVHISTHSLNGGGGGGYMFSVSALRY